MIGSGREWRILSRGSLSGTDSSLARRGRLVSAIVLPHPDPTLFGFREGGNSVVAHNGVWARVVGGEGVVEVVETIEQGTQIAHTASNILLR